MPLPKRLARFNRRVANPILGRLGGRLRQFAIVVHRGRDLVPGWLQPALTVLGVHRFLQLRAARDP